MGCQTPTDMQQLVMVAGRRAILAGINYPKYPGSI